MFKELIKNIFGRISIRKYDDFTIAEYFRSRGAQIGYDCRIMIRNIDEPFLIRIGNHCSISSGVRLITHDGGGWIFFDEDPTLQRFGPITICDNSYIGMDSIVLPDVTIGPNAIVGAGAVVTKNVPAGKVVAGNPARIIKDIGDYKAKLSRIWKEQKPKDYLLELPDSGRVSARRLHQLKNTDKNSSILRSHLIKIFSNYGSC